MLPFESIVGLGLQNKFLKHGTTIPFIINIAHTFPVVSTITWLELEIGQVAINEEPRSREKLQSKNFLLYKHCLLRKHYPLIESLNLSLLPDLKLVQSASHQSIILSLIIGLFRIFPGFLHEF
jgi:hypothetical protein